MAKGITCWHWDLIRITPLIRVLAEKPPHSLRSASGIGIKVTLESFK